ncbi:hypothetical protein ACJX0J_007962 [Zea mays]
MMMLSCYVIKENKHIIFYKRNYADLVIWNYLSHICASITSLLLQHKFTIGGTAFWHHHFPLPSLHVHEGILPSNRFTATYSPRRPVGLKTIGTGSQIPPRRATLG